MVTKDDARAAIAALADKYSQISKSDLKNYTEEDTKKDFLVPMFRALGWEMEDRSEVRAEEQIGTGFADYSFRINGVTNFYLEAKRFSADLNDKKYMQQAINYAYLKGVTWTVLSDFEQLMVFNADWEERDPLKSRFIDLTWEQYADDGFEQLWLLAKPSLEDREIDAAAEKWGKKKSRARVTDVLFADLTKWRQALFRDIRGFSETLWSQDATKVDEAIQRFLDRLIFVRTVEDRQIEENRLRSLLRQYEKKRGGKKNLFQDLLVLFRELDDIYNARLFAQTTLDHLTVNDENLLRDIIDGLYDVQGGFANYDFSAIDADVLGAVYEQYLGFKAQDPKGEDAIDLRKTTKRKAQGIYYTPHFVVRYIVQQTLGKLLNAPDMTPEKAHQLRILDPACGSGSFLIEAFDVLDSWLAEHGDERDKKFPQQRKMRILQENIYGVDLDPQAVEVARLNLLLRAARERKLLPMLDNIKHGNSLIDDPAVAGEAAFDWGEQFRAVMLAGGFDVVIGNPPYGAKLSSEQSDFLSEKFATFSRTKDVYTCFLELGYSIQNDGGKFGLIIPAGWLGGPAYEDLRRFILGSQIDSIITLPFDIFDAYIDTLIIVSSNQTASQNHRVLTYEYPKKLNLLDVEISLEQYRRIKQSDWLSTDNHKFVLDLDALKLIERLRASCDNTFSQAIKIRRGVLFDNELLTKTRQTNKQFLYFEGSIYRYETQEQLENWVEYGPKMKEYPKQFHWFENERILLRRLVNRRQRLMSSLVTDTFITNKNLYVVKSNNLGMSNHFLLGLLNSKLISYIYIKQVSTATKDDFPQVTITDVKALPFPQVDKSSHDRMVGMVERMLALKQAHAAAESTLDDKRHDLARQIEQLDADIDALVYDLYGLTDEEIAIVEGAD